MNESDINVKLSKANMIWDGLDIGISKNNSTILKMMLKTVQLTDVEQLSDGTVAEADQVDAALEFETELYNTSFDFLLDKLLKDGRVKIITSAGKRKAVFTGKQVNLRAIAKRMIIHPFGVAVSNTNDDVCLYKCIPDFTDGIEIKYSNSEYPSIKVKFLVFPDFSQSVDGANPYGAIKNWDISAGTPLGSFLAYGTKPLIPFQSLQKVDLKTDAKQQVNAFEFHANTTDGATAVASVLDISQTDIAYTGLTAEGDLTGKFILIDSEVMYVEVDTKSSATAGTLTVSAREKTAGTTATTHLASATIKVLVDYSTPFVTEYAGFNSATPSVASVGNIYDPAGEVSTNKGVITALTTGTSVLTAMPEIGSPVSPDCTITVS